MTYNSMVASTSDPHSLNVAASQLWTRGAAAEAEAAWAAAIRVAPRFVDAHANLASALLRGGGGDARARAGRAWRTLRTALELAPRASHLYARMGAAVVAVQPIHELRRPALRCVARLALTAARLRPGDSSLWCNLGLALAAYGARRQARQAYARAALLAPFSGEPHLGLAGVLPTREASIRTLRRALTYAPTSEMVYYNLGNLLHHAAEPARTPWHTWSNMSEAASRAAVRCFDAAAALRPTLVDAYYNAGLSAQQAHIDVPAATERAFRHALALAPRDRRVVSRLHTTLDWAGRASEAHHIAAAAVRAGLWAHAAQRPAHLVPHLRGGAPWGDARAYGAMRGALRRAHAALLGEWRAVRDGGWMRRQPEGLQQPGQQWHVFDLSAACAGAGAGAEAEAEAGAVAAEAGVEAASQASSSGRAAGRAAGRPRLDGSCAVLRSLRAAGGAATPPYAPLKAQFSTMAAGVHVRPHTGPTNAKLTVHYGLDVPDGSVIRVHDEARPFEQRGLLVFDDSWEHEVWQNGTTPRTTLVVHVAHPQLSTPLAGRNAIR